MNKIQITARRIYTNCSAHCFYIFTKTVVCACVSARIRVLNMHFSLLFSFFLFFRISLVTYKLKWNTYQRCQKKNGEKLTIWWNSISLQTKKLCCAHEFAMYVCAIEIFFHLWWKKNLSNHSDGSEIGKEKEISLCGRWFKRTNHTHKKNNYEKLWWPW